LYQQKLRNSEIKTYWFDYLSSAEFERKFLGAVSRQEEEADSNGTVFEDQPASRRRKRQASTILPPECKNLPVYKNWIEEGKTAPVQNQYGCGMIEFVFVLSKKTELNISFQHLATFSLEP
jgi:hypothetical protein